MTAVAAWRDQVTARLRGELGEVVRVADDPRAVNPPCVLVGFPSTVAVAGPCTYAVTMPVYVVAPPPGHGANTGWLLAQVVVVLRVLRGDGAGAAVATFLDVGDGAAPAPAYQIDLATQVPDLEVNP